MTVCNTVQLNISSTDDNHYPDAMTFKKGVSPSDVCRYEKRWSSSAEVDKGLLVGRIPRRRVNILRQTTIDDSGAGE
jgi:hypothetical protein